MPGFERVDLGVRQVLAARMQHPPNQMPHTSNCVEKVPESPRCSGEYPVFPRAAHFEGSYHAWIQRQHDPPQISEKAMGEATLDSSAHIRVHPGNPDGFIMDSRAHQVSSQPRPSHQLQNPLFLAQSTVDSDSDRASRIMGSGVSDSWVNREASLEADEMRSAR